MKEHFQLSLQNLIAYMARPGLMVTLNLKQFAGPGRARFRGDTGPGVMMEDHFGDGELWRVRWIKTVRCM